MTALTIKVVLENCVNMKQHVKYIGQRSFKSKVIVLIPKQTHIHTADQLLYLDHQSGR